ncbi:hypothetical protein BDZ94DRAFT_70699 [Collybia nuda]|uniref:Uncharacterized protein n=1 Tax=Collybia nuda TaxID=64659 RepID=A0A9P5XZX3_9AGAR|nr:hypothetical protein BDZ94DRAFT_70699 [Collybia nuda]
MFASLFHITRSSTARISYLQARTIHSSPVAYKTVTEKVSEVADKVNRKVGKGLASAIETGENATQVTKEKLGLHHICSPGLINPDFSLYLGSTVEQSKEKADHASNLASQKTNQAAAGAREAKKDFEKEVTK